MKFIHTADIHLGAAPDSGYAWSRKRQGEIWDTFRAIIDDAGREKADLLLIAGDLFHHPPTEEQLREVNYQFARIPQTRVILMAGNHDWIGPDSPVPGFAWEPNVAGLFSESFECVRFPEIHTEVYGLSYHRQMITEALYDEVPTVRGRNFKILLAHGGDGKHIPIHADRLERSGFDYIALGHIHRPGMLVRDKAWYSGAPEPIDCGDTGPHGYILGEVRGGRLKTRFVIKGCREYKEIRISCTAGDTTYAVRDRLLGEIAEAGDQNIYRVVLTGRRQPGLRFDTGRLAECGQILDVTDETLPEFHMEELKRNYAGSLIGEYIESFEDHERGEVEEKALRYGLEALLGAGPR